MFITLSCFAVLFCLAAEAIGLNGYYETATPKLMEQLPADIDLVFWSKIRCPIPANQSCLTLCSSQATTTPCLIPMLKKSDSTTN